MIGLQMRKYKDFENTYWKRKSIVILVPIYRDRITFYNRSVMPIPSPLLVVVSKDSDYNRPKGSSQPIAPPQSSFSARGKLCAKAVSEANVVG